MRGIWEWLLSCKYVLKLGFAVGIGVTFTKKMEVIVCAVNCSNDLSHCGTLQKA